MVERDSMLATRMMAAALKAENIFETSATHAQLCRRLEKLANDFSRETGLAEALPEGKAGVSVIISEDGERTATYRLGGPGSECLNIVLEGEEARRFLRAHREMGEKEAAFKLARLARRARGASEVCRAAARREARLRKQCSEALEAEGKVCPEKAAELLLAMLRHSVATLTLEEAIGVFAAFCAQESGGAKRVSTEEMRTRYGRLLELMCRNTVSGIVPDVCLAVVRA